MYRMTSGILQNYTGNMEKQIVVTSSPNVDNKEVSKFFSVALHWKKLKSAVKMSCQCVNQTLEFQVQSQMKR